MLAPFEKQTLLTAAPNVVSSRDRAMTVREWDPVLQLLGYTLIVIYPHPFNLEAPRLGTWSLSGPAP